MALAGIHEIIFRSQGGPKQPWNQIWLSTGSHTHAHEGRNHPMLGRQTARQYMIHMLNSLLDGPCYYLGWLRAHGELLKKQIPIWYAQEIKSK